MDVLLVMSCQSHYSRNKPQGWPASAPGQERWKRIGHWSQALEGQQPVELIPYLCCVDGRAQGSLECPSSATDVFTQPSQGALPQQMQPEAIPGFKAGADIKTLKGI